MLEEKNVNALLFLTRTLVSTPANYKQIINEMRQVPLDKDTVKALHLLELLLDKRVSLEETGLKLYRAKTKAPRIIGGFILKMLEQKKNGK